jgi:hypothetical protein
MLLTYGVDEHQDCFAIATPSAKYYYQSEAGGFSSICDRDGVDWINFHPGRDEVPGGAASVFRGLPNLVHPQGLGHPGFAGCSSRISMDSSTITVTTRSKEQGWEWRVRFFNEFVKFSITQTPEDARYWFLYEGTIGGAYDPSNSYWGLPSGKRNLSSADPDLLSASNPFPGEQWVYFGHNSSPRVFFCARLDEGGEESVLYFMGADERKLKAKDGMMVFGFGRGEGVTKLFTGKREFIIGFAEITDHEEVATTIENFIAQAQNTE